MTPARFKNAKWEDIPKQIQDLVENITVSKKGFYLWGPSGCGKTHIAYAIANTLPQRETGAVPVSVFNVPVLIDTIRRDQRRPGEEEFDRRRLRGSVLILDDIGSQKMSAWVEEQLYLLIHDFYEAGSPIIWTSNYPVKDLSNIISDRLISRIVSDCDIIELAGSDKRLKANGK